MILDLLDESSRYESLHPLFAEAFAFLRSQDLMKLDPGRHELRGGMYVNVDRPDGKGKSAAVLESHRKHIDIQCVAEGLDVIGHLPVAWCLRARSAYSEERDVLFYDDRPDLWVTLPPGLFAVFFPHDAHAPLAGSGHLRKIVVKVPV